MPDNRKPLIYGAFPVCRNYTVRAHQRKLADSRPCSCYGGVGPSGSRQDQHHNRYLCRVHPVGGRCCIGCPDRCVYPDSGRKPRIKTEQPTGGGDDSAGPVGCFLYDGLCVVLFIGCKAHRNVPYLCLICRKQLEMNTHERE